MADNNQVDLRRLWRGLYEITHIKCVIQCLEHSKCSVNVGIFVTIILFFNIYLAALGACCGTRDLCCIVWDLLL